MQLHTVEFGVTNHVASRLPCEVGNVRGYFRGSTDSWLQLHDAAQLPANGAVPLFSIALFGAAYYSWPWPKPVSLQNGAVFAVSTTEATLTISAELADFHVDGSANAVVSSASIVGDRTTARETLDLFTSTKLLHQVYLYDPRSTPLVSVWAMLFEANVADLITGQVPLIRHKFPSTQQQRERIMSFGNLGKSLSKACIVASSTGPGYTATGNGDDLYVEAVYK